MWATILSILGWLLSLLTGKSAQERAGQAEATVKQQSEVLSNVQKARDADELADRLGDDALKLQLSKYRRD